MAVDWDKLVLGPLHQTFGEPEGTVAYRPQTGPAFTLEGGVFDAGHRELDALPGVPISTTGPTLGVRLAAFPAGIEPQQNDKVTVRGKIYQVRDVQPDSHGEARLLLIELP